MQYADSVLHRGPRRKHKHNAPLENNYLKNPSHLKTANHENNNLVKSIFKKRKKCHNRGFHTSMRASKTIGYKNKPIRFVEKEFSTPGDFNSTRPCKIQFDEKDFCNSTVPTQPTHANKKGCLAPVLFDHSIIF